MTTICSFCGLDLTDRETDDKYLICPHCNVFIPKGASSWTGHIKKTRGKRSRRSVNKISEYMDERRCGTMEKPKKVKEKKEKVKRTLTCSRCSKEKKAGKKRIAKWAGKEKSYLCRECRKIVKAEAKKAKEILKKSEKKK